MIIAIDGPAGSGKSTVTHLLAQKLGFIHIDTGAIYRCIALQAMEQSISLDDELSLVKFCVNSTIQFQRQGAKNLVFLNGRDVSEDIRTPEISSAASTVSAHSGVRRALLDIQRKTAEAGHVVLEGRDIGTVVFPHAEVKFFLTASVDTRAQRRMAELESKGIYLSFEDIRNQVESRDRADSSRAVAPLKQAADAILMDSTRQTIDEVVNRMETIVREKMLQLKVTGA